MIRMGVAETLVGIIEGIQVCESVLSDGVNIRTLVNQLPFLKDRDQQLLHFEVLGIGFEYMGEHGVVGPERPSFG